MTDTSPSGDATPVGAGQTGTQFGRHVGQIFQARSGISLVATNWPNVVNTFVLLRWLLWSWAGWPLFGTVLAVQFAYVIGTHWILSAVVFTVSFLISLIPADIAKLLKPRSTVLAVWGPRVLTVALIGLRLATSSWLEIQVALGVTAMAWVIDRAAAMLIPSYDLWRLWCHVRRKFPMNWHIMASTTSRVQGAGVGSESSITRGSNRNYLNHPAMNYVPTFNVSQYEVTGTTSVPPGRDFSKYVPVLEEMAATYPVVASIRLPGFGVSDSHSLIVFKFHRASWFGWGRGG